MIYFSNYKIGLEDIGRNNEATNKALLAIMQDSMPSQCICDF